MTDQYKIFSENYTELYEAPNLNDISSDSIYIIPATYTLDSKNSKNSVHCCVKIRREREREANKVAGPESDTRDVNEV